MCSFMGDDRGATEPFTGLPALGIVAVGLIIFSFLLFSAYSSYATSAYYAAVRGELRSLARIAACDPMISDGPGRLDAHKLDNASKNGFGQGHGVQVAVEAQGYGWRFGQGSRGRSAIYVLPVSISLNDARCIPGALKVTIWEE